MIKVSPSILAADILNMGKDIGDMISAGADWLHLDMMDGHFVPNYSFGPSIVDALQKRFPSAYRDVHLMFDQPERYIDVFIEAGAQAVTVHQEAGDTGALLRQIKAHEGVLAGVSLKPKTPVDTLRPFFKQTDMILIMTVEPGFGGQKFMADAAQKVGQLRDMGFDGHISVDGGVNLENAQTLINMGADVLVLGTALFKAQSRREAIALLHAMEKSNG